MTKHQQVHIEFRGPLQNSAGDIVLRCTHDLAVRIDACGGQPVDQSLDRLAVRAFDVLVGGAHAEARAADDVTRDDVPPRHVKDVHRRTRQPSDLFGPRLRRSVLFSRRGVDRYATHGDNRRGSTSDEPGHELGRADRHRAGEQPDER